MAAGAAASCGRFCLPIILTNEEEMMKLGEKLILVTAGLRKMVALSEKEARRYEEDPYCLSDAVDHEVRLISINATANRLLAELTSDKGDVSHD